MWTDNIASQKVTPYFTASLEFCLQYVACLIKTYLLLVLPARPTVF